MSNAPKPLPPEWRPDIINIPMGQPLPPPPGIQWWLKLLMSRR